MIELAKQLQQETPKARRVRIMGKLDALFYEDQALVLQLVDGARLRGAWMKDSPESMRDSWGNGVLIEGQVQFKPNGDPLALEAELITAASEQDQFWLRLPIPMPKITKKPTRPAIRPAKNPWDLVVGIWPGDEDEDAFAALVERASRVVLAREQCDADWRCLAKSVDSRAFRLGPAGVERQAQSGYCSACDKAA